MSININKNKNLKNILQGTKIHLVAGCHDALSAKIAGESGFDAIWASGLGISAVNAVPDMSILTMREMLDSAAAMAMATDIPIIADCDAGFGNIHNVAWMVKNYEQRGVSAVCIEDKTHPKINSFADKTQYCVSIKEFVEKIKVAKFSQQSEDFSIIARCESLIAGLSMQEALDRCHAYVEAGADAVLIHSKQKTADEIIAFLESWNKRAPVVVVPTTYPQINRHLLQELGVQLVIYANQALRAAAGSMQKIFADIRGNDSTEMLESDIVSVKKIFELQGVHQTKDLEEQFIQ